MYSLNSSQSIKIAVVGCGRIFQKHLEAIAFHSQRAELVAICDVSEHALNVASDLIDNLNKSDDTLNIRPKKFLSFPLLLALVKKMKY